ncbi:hypothetical protein AHF37_06963 [Paragonimus kellicotti]|nr:hypothetical protein AHF37_06963 [Paragonimus kellicotti]
MIKDNESNATVKVPMIPLSCNPSKFDTAINTIESVTFSFNSLL